MIDPIGELMTQDVILAAIVVFFGGFVQTSIGFGLAVVSAPLLFIINPSYVPAPITIATTVNCVFVFSYFRQSLSIKELVPAFIWRVPGSVCGAILLWALNEKLLALMIALLIGVGVLVNYFRINIALSKRNLGLAGFFSGVTGTSTSIGGPPMAILLQGLPPNKIRSQLSAFFLFSCFISLMVLAVTDHLNKAEWLLGLYLMPSTLLGSWVGALVSQKIKPEPMRIATLLLCVISVAVMLRQYLVG
ncbi:MAG: sulfite exporter TauE/SafE family protein [Cellvibrionaceae bacterium]